MIGVMCIVGKCYAQGQGDAIHRVEECYVRGSSKSSMHRIEIISHVKM